MTTNQIPTPAGAAAAAVPPVAGQYAPMMAYSLGMVTVDNVTGKDISRYFDRLEQRAELDGWTELETLRIFKYKCIGDAYDFLSSDSTLRELGYRDLKAKFLEHFATTLLPGEYQLSLNKCYQRHDESVTGFCTQLRLIGTKLLKEDLKNATQEEKAGIRKKNQELILNQFKMGLRRDILKEVGLMLLREDNLTLEKAEE
uniref:Retrotransposon gag domain-containing protein n=1 Tax=Anoplophora glabripennis TaxID=217634 RepID=V5GVE6_ANOGL